MARTTTTSTPGTGERSHFSAKMTTSEPTPKAAASGCTSPSRMPAKLATTSCRSDSASIEKPSSFGICEMITMQRDRVEVADADRLGQQVGHEPEPQDAAEQQHPADHDRQQAGERDRPLVVAEREREDRRGDDGGERRVRPEHEDARRAEHGIRDQRHDRGVEAGLRREPGHFGVAHARGDEQRRHDEAGPHVRPQPGASYSGHGRRRAATERSRLALITRPPLHIMADGHGVGSRMLR